MKPTVLKKPQVAHDLVEHFAFIARDKLQPAERFLKVAETTFDRLAAMPRIGKSWDSPHKALAGVRFVPMARPFHRYFVFYRPIAAGVEILTVLRGERDLAAVLDKLSDKK